MRKLASIQKVIDVQPISGADAIERITVLGWHLVAKKGEFRIGDLCTYFEVDSLLPMIDIFSFLAKNGTKKIIVDGKEVEGYRLKTVRLRGQISQGLAIPLVDTQTHWEGEDVTEVLGVYKYEPPVPGTLLGKAKGQLPSFIPKTDETRIQAVPHLLERYSGQTFYITEKLDGTSTTVWFKDGELNVAGRTVNWLPESKNSYWKAVGELGLTENPERLGTIALQGELIGESIQKNTLKVTGKRLIFFNAFDYETGEYLSFEHFKSFCMRLGVECVPIIDNRFTLTGTVDQLVEMATRKSLINPDSWLEGLVFRPLVEQQDPDIGRLSFKVINPEFLLKNE